MPPSQPATAEIVQFPRALPRPLRFTHQERQALLALAYAVAGTGVDIAADGDGDEYASLGAADFAEGAWWTVIVTSSGFDVVNFTGHRVARFAAIGPLVDRMRPHMAHMLGLAAPGGDAQAAGSRTLTVV